MSKYKLSLDNFPTRIQEDFAKFLGMERNTILWSKNSYPITTLKIAIFLFKSYIDEHNLVKDDERKFVLDDNLKKNLFGLDYDDYVFILVHEIPLIIIRQQLSVKVRYVSKEVKAIMEEIQKILINGTRFCYKLKPQLIQIENEVVRKQFQEFDTAKMDCYTDEFKKTVLTLLCIQKFHMTNIDKNVFLMIFKHLSKNEEYILVETKHFGRAKTLPECRRYMSEIEQIRNQKVKKVKELLIRKE